MVEIFKEEKRMYYINMKNDKIYITDDLGNKLFLTDDFIDISYPSKQNICSTLSNLFPYEFDFLGFEVKSVEGVLQALKHNKPEIQKLVFNYFGKDAYNIRVASFVNDWRTTGLLYFMEETIDRFSMEYQIFLNQLYIAVNTNPLFARALEYTKGKELLHSSGENDPTQTILTPQEYIDRLLIIREYTLNSTELKKQLLNLSENITNSYSVKKYNNVLK